MKPIDAHFHIWRKADLPWLQGPMQPRIFGPYEPIRRDYPIDEYLEDAGDLAGSVYVQANWPVERSLDEVRWVSEVATASGHPTAIVAYADMLAPDVRPALDKLAAFPLVRGVRMQLHWHTSPEYRFAARPDLCEEPTLQANVRHLAERGYAFELQVFPQQMDGALRLVEACPEVAFVLIHAGMKEQPGEAAFAAWRVKMERLAEAPNLAVKLSGLGTFIRRNDAEHIARIVQATVELFGAERCLFGSNFPIEKLWCAYADLLAAFDAATKPLGEAARRAIFQTTAKRVYRLKQ
jgi:predicted TIM-barrel fold metal-dependent hydrolase